LAQNSPLRLIIYDHETVTLLSDLSIGNHRRSSDGTEATP
jgi:hypothetical protein